MLEHLGDNKTNKVIAYFGHATTIQLFLTALGVREGDSLLTENNFADMQNRKWKSSEISSFASNLAVVKYNCTPDPIVKFFLNERPLEFDWCDEKGLCKLSEINKEYSRYKEADCKTYYCSSKAKIVYEIFYIILGLISIYLY